MAHLLPDDLGNVIINYLASKPFAEVQGMIAEMQKLQEVADDGCPLPEAEATVPFNPPPPPASEPDQFLAPAPDADEAA